MNVRIETPGNEVYAELNDRLVEFNRGTSSWNPQPFSVAIYSDDGTLIGGVRAIVNMGLAEIRGLWIDPPYRKSGLGARLMSAVEKHAGALGATRAALDTYDWQARGFYERLGYVIYGTLAYPEGPLRYFMRKALAPTPEASK